MPEVIISHDHNLLITGRRMEELGKTMRPIIAAAFSTDVVTLNEDSIDWLPQVQQPGTLAPKFSIKITAIGYEDRMLKMDEETAKELKRAMWDAGLHPYLDPKEPFLWIIFVDKKGHHV